MSDGLARDVARIGRIDIVPKILEVVCRTTGMGFAAIARVTEDRWVACAVRDEINFGLAPGGELELKTTLCDEIRQSGEAIVIDHVSTDPRYVAHHTPAQYGLQSYISWPIIHDGQFFGTLCAIDPHPAQLKNPGVMGQFALFAELIGFHLDAQDRLALSEAALLDAQAAGELREQFIAVLGHDLRNPLASIQAGADLLRKTQLDARARQLVTLIDASANRMGGLIEDVLDFARGRLGGGIDVTFEPDPALTGALHQVIAEITAAHPHRQIRADIAIAQPVACDSRRIAQLFSNLLANAITHGAGDQPIEVAASTTGGVFTLAVANGGAPIPQATQQRLFQPFTRAADAPSRLGLGLGLYIASAIAEAHHGTMTVASDALQTRFTFAMPLGG